MMRVLGIETSCDETSAAVVDGDIERATQRSLVILSQDVHRVFGGVVPEIASRAHLTGIVPVVQRALDDASVALDDIDAVAVTNAPGLAGALLVGVSFAKAFAASSGIPVIGVHHMEAHLFAPSLEDENATPPFTALLVSGGHTMIVDVAEWGSYRVLGKTRDDAAGEAFDKVAKLLGLPYPGGPHVERAAAKGKANAYRFARPMVRRDQQPGDADYLDVSFSGLKTAVLHAARDAGIVAESSLGPDDERASVAANDSRVHDIARGFQDAVIDTLVEKTMRAVALHHRHRIVLGGGVAGSRALVAALTERAAARGVTVHAPSPRLATDNAAMVARAGLFHLARGERSPLSLSAFASEPLPGLVAT